MKTRSLVLPAINEADAALTVLNAVLHESNVNPAGKNVEALLTKARNALAVAQNELSQKLREIRLSLSEIGE